MMLKNSSLPAEVGILAQLRKIYYLSTAPATGKTTVLIYYAANLVSKRRHVLFVSPTIDLTEESYKRFKEKYPYLPATLIHSKQDSSPCAGRIAERMRDPKYDGEVLFIVLASFGLIRNDESKSGWTAIIDEIPPITHDTSKNLTDTFSILTDALEIDPVGAHYSELTVKSDGQERIASFHQNQSQDDVVEVLREIASLLVSEYWENHVKTEQYVNLIKGFENEQ